MKYYLFLLAFVAHGLLAQVSEKELWNKVKPRCIGPASMSGRVTAIAVVEKDPNIIYAGTASGGLWKSVNGGIQWQPVFDEMDVGSIGSVAICQSNPSIVFAGTGEGNPRNSHNSGKGIYKSMDGGKTWKKSGLENTRTIHRIIIHPQNPDIVYAACMGSIWGPGADRGVYQSKDGGKTWNKILYTNEFSGCAELVIDPNNPLKLFAAMYDYQRKPYTFRSGGKGSGLYMTMDGGENWSAIQEKNGLPSGVYGRIGIAVSAANSNRVYAIIESSKTSLYRSDDGGNNWMEISDDENIGNRPFYYNEIYADPINENHVISIWSQVSHSIDGGKTWSTLLDWGHVHPDHHAFYIHPKNNKFMIDGNDGGLNISTDGGKSWRYANNIPVGQFYHVNVDEDLPYHVYGGLQDNGSWRGPGFTFTDGGIRNSEWKELLFGDGFDVIPLNGNSMKGYAAWQGGNVYFYDLETGRTQAIQPVHPDNKFLRYNWNAAMAVHPQMVNTIYYGSQFIHKSYNNGLSWKIISPDLTTNDTSKLHQEKSGGLTIDATNAENYCTIISIVPAYSDTNVIYAGTDDGNLQLTRNGGKSWTLLSPKISGAPKNAWIPFIYVSKNNAADVWVVMNNYRQNDWQPYLYHSTDFGNTWKNMADPAQISGHCLSVFQDPIDANVVWLGTDHGLWISLNGGKNWKKFTSGMPSCPVQDIVYQESEDDVVIGTFGRSIYIFDNPELFRIAARNKQPVNKIYVYSATKGYIAHYTRPEGERFSADATFEGENKRPGCGIYYYISGNKNATGKWEKSTVKIQIYNSANKKIRTQELKMDSGGIYTYWWNLSADGMNFPTHRNMEKETNLPPGLIVSPGKYKIVFQINGESDSTIAEVKAANPAIWNQAAEESRSEYYNHLKTSVDRAYNAFEALKSAEESIKNIEKQNFNNDSSKSSITKLGNQLKDSIANLKLLFMQEKDARYIEDISKRLNDFYGLAYGFITSDEYMGENCAAAIKNAAKETDAAMALVNRFFENDWQLYRKKVEAEQLKLFKQNAHY